MSGPAALTPPAVLPAAVPRRAAAGEVLLIGLVATLSIALLVIEPMLALAPPVLVLLLWLPWKLPLRYSVFALTFVVLASEQMGDASGLWKSPFAVLGYLLRNNLNLVVPVGALRFTGIDALLAYLALIAAVRRSEKSDIDRGVVPPPRILTRVLLGSMGMLIFLIIYGVGRGGSAQQVPWQIHQLLLLAPLYLLYSVSIRGEQDLRTCGKVLIAAALVKAALAVWARRATGLDNTAMPTATSHADSALFCAAVTMLLIQLFDRVNRKNLQVCLLAIPPIALGMIANNRRLVWVEIGMVMILLLVLSRRTAAKQFVLRGTVLMLPILVLYVAAGWDSGSGIFKPVKTLRSVVDSKSDSSTATRDVENYNLLATARIYNPLFGTGFGHEYDEQVKMDDIARFFPQYRYIPHNSILGLWTFSGVLGFTFLLAPFAAGIYLAMRTYRHATQTLQRVGAFACLSAVLVYLVQAYGDMGLISWSGTLIVALAISLAGKLAVSTGAWWSSARPTPGPTPLARSG